MRGVYHTKKKKGKESTFFALKFIKVLAFLTCLNMLHVGVGVAKF